MARSFAAPASTGGRSRQGAGAGARDPWEDAAAAMQSRLSRTPSEPWGTGTRASTEAPVTDTWGTGASTVVPVTNFWGPRASRVSSVTDGWGIRASMEAPVTDTWSTWSSAHSPVTWGTWTSTDAPVSHGWGAMPSTNSPVSHGWGAMPSTDAPVRHGWGAMPSTDAPVSHGWGAMPSTDAPVTYAWVPGASEAARDPWSHGSSAGRSAPESSRFTVPPPSESDMLMNITVGNAKAFLHCSVCSLPLKAPIFQCDAGHAVCSACRDEPLGSGTGRTCNACRGPGYRRCRLMEGLLETLRVACPNAARGCDATPAYYDLHAHTMACAHAPGTRCPVCGCGFVAPRAELLDHFAALHEWPVTTEERVGKSFDIHLCDGFNVVATAVRDGSNQQHLLLLNVVRQPFGRTISAVCIHPQPAVVEASAAAVTKTVELELRYWAARHYQESEFHVPFVDLADGPPNDLAQFVVPKSDHSDHDATVLVTAFLTIK